MEDSPEFFAIISTKEYGMKFLLHSQIVAVQLLKIVDG